MMDKLKELGNVFCDVLCEVPDIVKAFIFVSVISIFWNIIL
jgi:hypothetical protein